MLCLRHPGAHGAARTPPRGGGPAQPWPSRPRGQGAKANRGGATRQGSAPAPFVLAVAPRSASERQEQRRRSGVPAARARAARMEPARACRPSQGTGSAGHGPGPGSGNTSAHVSQHTEQPGRHPQLSTQQSEARIPPAPRGLAPAHATGTHGQPGPRPHTEPTPRAATGPCCRPSAALTSRALGAGGGWMPHRRQPCRRPQPPAPAPGTVTAVCGAAMSLQALWSHEPWPREGREATG